MIEELHGRRETVLHPATQAFRLYMNIEAENYPAHWHTDLEIIMPIENIHCCNREAILLSGAK